MTLRNYEHSVKSILGNATIFEQSCNKCCNTAKMHQCRKQQLLRSFDRPAAFRIKVRPHAEKTQLVGLTGQPARSCQNLRLAQPQAPGAVSARARESPRLRTSECSRAGASAKGRCRYGGA